MIIEVVGVIRELIGKDPKSYVVIHLGGSPMQFTCTLPKGKPVTKEVVIERLAERFEIPKEEIYIPSYVVIPQK